MVRRVLLLQSVLSLANLSKGLVWQSVDSPDTFIFLCQIVYTHYIYSQHSYLHTLLSSNLLYPLRRMFSFKLCPQNRIYQVKKVIIIEIVIGFIHMSEYFYIWIDSFDRLLFLSNFIHSILYNLDWQIMNEILHHIFRDFF